jgi:hypothetical protein
MPRDPNPYPVPAKVRVCRAASCVDRADSGAVPGFCVEHADVILTFRRFLGSASEFSGDGLERTRPATPSFDASRIIWERRMRSR